MSNASSKRFLLSSPHCGAFALVEFLLAGGLGVVISRVSQAHSSVSAGAGVTALLALAYALSIVSVVLFVMHSIVMLRRRVWDAWFSLLAVLLIYFLSQAVAGALVYVYPLLRGWTEARATFWLNNSVAAQFSYFLLAAVLALGGTYAYLRRFGIRLAAIGLRRPRWRDLAYGVASVPFYFVLYLLTVGVVSHFVPGLDVNQKQQLGFDNVHGLVPLALTFISLVLLPPLMEEIMVRGLLYSSLKKALPVATAVVTTSLIFASAHLPEGGASGPLYIAALDTFVLSLVLIYLREKTDGLWSSMTLHAIKNGIAFVALFVVHVH